MKALRELLDNMPGSDDIIIISDQASRSAVQRKKGCDYPISKVSVTRVPTNKEYEEVLMSVPLSELQKKPLKYRPKNQKEDKLYTMVCWVQLAYLDKRYNSVC